MDYITVLRQRVREQQEQRALLLAKQAKPAPPPPVTDQIRAILAALPQATVMRPWSLDELRAQVKGRFGRPPQRGEIAAALRLLNFRPARLWNKGYCGRHVWLPEGYEISSWRKEKSC